MVLTLDKDFEAICEDDIPLLQKYLGYAQYEESNHNIVNMMLWKHTYPLWLCKKEHWILLLGIHEDEFFVYMPLCKREYVIPAIQYAKQIFDRYQMPFILSSYTKEIIELIAPVFPEYHPQAYRDPADYVYLSEKFRTFSGKKLQKKRNHLNAFYKTYEGRYQYETITPDNIEDCRRFLRAWKPEDTDEFLNEERIGVETILDMYQQLPVKGGLIRIDGDVKAFIIGSLLTPRMCQINIEKADDDYRGLYQAISKEFMCHEFLDTIYVNREDDMGKENIRKAKMSYYPEMLIYKYRLAKGSSV